MTSLLTKFNSFIKATNYLHLPELSYIVRWDSNNHQGISKPKQRLHFQRVGTGPHGILCLPGALGTIETDFGAQFKHLNKEKFTIVSWDPPGYGQSRPPDPDFAIGVQRLYNNARLAHWMMKEHKFKTYSVLGWSEGGRTALILAATFPRAVRHLVTWGGSAFLTQDDITRYTKHEDIDTWSPKMYAMMHKIYGETAFRKLWTTWVRTHVLIFNGGGDICKNQLPKIKCPTLILHGEKDPLVHRSHMEYIHQQIPQSQLYIVANAKHNLHLRYYEEFNALVEDFLTQKKKS